MKYQIFILALGFLIIGCETYQVKPKIITWNRPGAIETDFHREKLQCEILSVNLYPVQRQPSYTTNCSNYYGSVSCDTNQNYTYDANQMNRIYAWNSCMKSKGWIQHED